jgi:hypothetical protein
LLRIEGENLSVDPQHPQVAIFNRQLADVIEYGPQGLAILLAAENIVDDENELVLTLDPYCIVRVKVNKPSAGAEAYE